ncbi:MAG: sodium/solute symporter [Chitinophagales bacterium]
MNFSTLDWIVFIAYLCFMIAIGIYLSLSNKSKDSKEYFLAGRNLAWWAIGASLIASNISAEQFIGMSGSGFKFGLAVASYEFMAAITLIIVAWLFLPIYLKKGIYTLPQFIEQRFSKEVRTGLAIFWLLIFVFINVTSVLYLGALTLKASLQVPLFLGVLCLALYSASFSIFGGLKTVVLTDIVQVVVLLLGGLLTSYLALDAYGGGIGFFASLKALYLNSSDKFNMIISKGETIYAMDNGELRDAWLDLPGISVLLGGMWIANLYYWGMNQYIIQRALAAKNLYEARKGIVFAAFIKIILPLIVVIPGIVAFSLNAPVAKGDEVYSWVLNNFIPAGLKGICFAAVIAAVGSSISSMVNSVSTIFTMDIYKAYINKNSSDSEDVKVGKITAFLALLLGALIAPSLSSLDQAFKFIQDFTGFFSPGILVIFLFGLFWKRASNKAALSVLLFSLPLSFGLGLLFSEDQLPFMNRMGLSFLLLSLLMIFVSLKTNPGTDAKAVAYEDSWFSTSKEFKLASLAICAILAAIYITLA